MKEGKDEWEWTGEFGPRLPWQEGWGGETERTLRAEAAFDEVLGMVFEMVENLM